MYTLSHHAHSPHVTTFCERVQVDGHPIPADQWQATMAQHASAIQRAAQEAQGALSHFEVVTALALRHFRDEQVCRGPHYTVFAETPGVRY